MTKHCIVCDSIEAESLYPAIVKCVNCGYVYADLDLTQDEFAALYNSGYFKGEEYSNYLSDKEMLQKNFGNRLETLKKYINPDMHKSILEVGSAYGFFLEMVSSDFERVVGIDVVEDGVKYARDKLKLNVYNKDLLEWDFENQNYDIACMWDTIEHLRSPDRYLEKIAKHMPKGGLLAITTGDIDSRVARWRKNHWRLIHPPTHAHYFSKTSMTDILDRYGFDVVHFEHCGFYRSIDNIAYNLLALRSNLSWLYKFLKFTRITKLGFYTNLYDIMYVVARKR